MNDEERFADRLDSYLDHPEQYDGALDPAEERVADILRRAATTEHPRPGFVNELAQQLRRKDLDMNEFKKHPGAGRLSRLARLAFGGLTVAALLFVAVYASGLLRAPTPEPAVEDRSTPETAEEFAPTEGPLAGHRLQISASLDDRPAEAQLYQSSGATLPDTVAGAMALGRSFGMGDPHVYESQADAGNWIVRDDDVSTISYRPAAETPGPAGLYYAMREERRLSIEGQPMPFADAVRVAVAFLEQAGFLPEEYDVSEQPWTGDTPLRLVEIQPLLDGRPIEGDQAVSRVAVLPGGAIAMAQISPLNISALDQTVPVKSARQALEALLQGQGGYSFSYENMGPGAQQQRVFFAEREDPQPGEPVTVNGWANVLVSKSDGHYLVQLSGGPGRGTYELTGAGASDLAEAGGGEVEVVGTIEEVRQSGITLLNVEGWQPAPAQVEPPDCRSGVLAREGDRASLRVDGAQIFNLGHVDEALQGGERIEVCAERFEEDGVVSWLYIASPPSSEVARSGGGGGGGSSGTVVQAVEVTRVIETEAGEAVTAEQVALPVAESGGPSSPFTIGEQVNVSGIVGGYMRREGDSLVPNLVLEIDIDGDPFTPPASYPLYGSQALLEELSTHYGTYVNVNGEVVEGSSESMIGPQNQALRVASFEISAGSEGMRAFLGRIERQTIDGEEEAIFVDEESGERYVLAQGLGMESDQQKVLVTGYIHPDAQVDGLPVLVPNGMRSGSQIDAAESAEEIAIDTEIHIMEEGPPSSPGGGLPQVMLIDEVTLGYTLNAPGGNDGAALTPTWLFYGHSPDGSTTFVLQMSAVVQ